MKSPPTPGLVSPLVLSHAETNKLEPEQSSHQPAADPSFQAWTQLMQKLPAEETASAMMGGCGVFVQWEVGK